MPSPSESSARQSQGILRQRTDSGTRRTAFRVKVRINAGFEELTLQMHDCIWYKVSRFERV